MGVKKKKMTVIIITFLILVFLAIGFMVFKNLKSPTNLGVENGILAKLSSKPNGVSTQAKDLEKYVEPFEFIENLELTKAKILEVLNKYERFTIIEESSNYIRVVFTTGIMHYKDDGEFYFNEKDKKVHYRSQSRIGYSDMGLNRKRYNELYYYYTEE